MRDGLARPKPGTQRESFIRTSASAYPFLVTTILRSTPFLLTRVPIAAFLVLAGAGVAVGCSAETTSADDVLGAARIDRDEETPTTPPNYVGAEEDASSAKSIYRGNPLCRVQGDTCMPDDDGIRKTVGVQHCGPRTPLETDAGTSMPSDPTEGCRVRKASGNIAPSCQPETGAGGDGVACETGADCAVGFDCVVGTSGDKAKACRHYCCVGACKTQRAQNGGPTFCDVQRLAEFAINVPVCMPLKTCKPFLSSQQCAQNETCAIVSDSGDFGCVTVGDKQVGESCDEDHCATNLTCLGQPGARKCVQLCDPTKASSCGPIQKCATSPIFKDANVGICQAP